MRATQNRNLRKHRENVANCWLHHHLSPITPAMVKPRSSGIAAKININHNATAVLNTFQKHLKAINQGATLVIQVNYKDKHVRVCLSQHQALQSNNDLEPLDDITINLSYCGAHESIISNFCNRTSG